MHKRQAVCLTAVLVILAAPSVFAAGTPNLGCPAVLGEGSAFAVDVRAFDTIEDQDTLDNAVWSLGYTGAVNEKVDFGLWFSKIDVQDLTWWDDDSYYGYDWLSIERKVLTPSLKWLLSSPSAKAQTALTVGADIMLDDNVVKVASIYTDQGYTEHIFYEDFVPAVRLQSMWGKPGKFQFQLAGQANFFKDQGRYLGQYYPASPQLQYGPDGPGTVLGSGGGTLYFT